MSARVVTASPHDPRADRISAAEEVLRAGGVIALPTETFYGLAVDALRAEAVAKLNRLKGKAESSPSLLMLADPAQARMVASELSPEFERLAGRFWPGPLTLVVPAAPELPREVHGGLETVGLRVPGVALPRRIAAALGRPITGVSANLHGEPPARTAAEVLAALGTGLELILDGGPTPGGAPSTIIDLTGQKPRILREGAVPRAALEPFVTVCG